MIETKYPLADEEAALCHEIEAWSKEQGLEWLSADEMLYELAEKHPEPDERSDTVKAQINWLVDFCERWEELMKRQDKLWRKERAA